MKILLIVLVLTLAGCATGVSKYKYVHSSDGSTYVEVHSANEIEEMEMGINRETGTLEVKIGGMTKKSDTVEVMASAERMVHDITNPGGIQ